MRQSKHQFYRTGPENQTRADVTIDLKRVDIQKIDKWTPEQKENLKVWLDKVAYDFHLFKQEILALI